jgi:hypothetical protein
VPRQLVLAAGSEPVPERDDRALPGVVDHRERGPAGRVSRRGVELDLVGPQIRPHVAGDAVVSQRREEEARAGELGELDGGDRASAAGALPGLGGVLDPTGRWDPVDAREPDPFDVADHGQPHRGTVAVERSRVR